MNSAVERAAKCIWERYSEPLPLSDIAKSAMLSRFHLCRKFRAAVSLSPVRFLSAVRIYHAKRLLATTSRSITDISFAVGYNSVGSFTNYFTRSVTLPPGLFRHMARNGGFELPCPGRDSSPAHGAVYGTISLPAGYAGARVYLGAFTTPIVQYAPAAAVVVDIPAGGQRLSYRLPAVPAGKWFIHAVATADTTAPEPWTRRTSLVGGHSPIPVTADGAAVAAIRLRPRRMTDPPVLLALPDLETQTACSEPSEGGLILSRTNGRT